MSELVTRNRILVVDDDPVVRRMWQRSLELANYDVLVAPDGAKGLQRLREDPTIGLVLIDLMMPVVDGWEFLRQQRADPEIAAVPTVVVSGSSVSPEEARIAVPLLRKPVARDQLLKVVASFCTPETRP